MLVYCTQDVGIPAVNKNEEKKPNKKKTNKAAAYKIHRKRAPRSPIFMPRKS